MRLYQTTVGKGGGGGRGSGDYVQEGTTEGGERRRGRGRQIDDKNTTD